MSRRQPKILIVDDDESYQLGLRYYLKKDFDVRSAYNGDEALAIVKNHVVDLLLLDVRMRTDDEGLKFIPLLREADPELCIIMSSGVRDFETVREAMQLGAIDYIPKDAEPEEVVHSLKRVLEKKDLIQAQQQHAKETRRQQKTKQLIGKSPSIIKLRSFIEKIRKSPANVVITGETGVGKEVVARLMRQSTDVGGLEPFVAIDSSTIQSTMAESLLFGHEKGAFTGADQQRKGAFEEANGGIIYFDEISNMPLEIQAKLLRVIQEKEVTRLGSARVIPLEFRVVCASNKDLEQQVKNGKFMEDLYQRLNVLPITIPPLRDRKEDLVDLIEYFSDSHATDETKIYFTDDAIRVLENYDWPGNIRELNNLIAYLTAIADKDEVDVGDLPNKLFKESDKKVSAHAAGSDDSGKSIYERLQNYERQILVSEFKKQGGNISRMALSLGMDRSHLYTKLKTYGIFMKKQNRKATGGEESKQASM